MGWLVLSANYSLSKTNFSTKAGGATFPEHLHDCLRAVAWARGPQAAKFGGGGKTLALAGESAGGHLACLAGLTHSASHLHPPDIHGADMRVDAVIDLYGVHDIQQSNSFKFFFRHVILKRSSKGE